MSAHPELCAKCGAPVRRRPGDPFARLCPRHLHEALRDAPPIACTTDDIDRGMFWLEHGRYPGEAPTPEPVADVIPLRQEQNRG